jgi:transposase
VPNFIHNRCISVFLFIILREFGVNWYVIEIILQKFECLNIKHAHKWANLILNANDANLILEDNRGSYNRCTLYDMFPGLEDNAKLYAIQQCSRKESSFSLRELAKFITEKYKDYGGEIEADELIRSEASCRIDLLKWGAVWDSNKKRPYFEGHERDDVVKHRQSFIDYFLTNIKSYYHPYPIDSADSFEMPDNTASPKILIAHDEPTFRSNETQLKRWFFMKYAVFFNKCHGKSLMHSSFLVQHPTEPLFRLSESEWKDAIQKYPDLEDQSNLDYQERSADAFIQPGKVNYYDNSTILSQFERLFKMLQFKKSFFNHKIEIIVDNARTYTAVNSDVNNFSLKPGTICPYESIDWVENGVEFSVDCFDEDGTSKGLKVIAAELGFQFVSNKKYLLKEYRKAVSSHIAFQNKTKLESLADKYDIKIIFCPKFHCELNPIEGLWCFMKNYIRKYTDQSFEKLQDLTNESLIKFKETGYNFKLWRRFWRLLALYKEGKSYEEVLQSLFSKKSQGTAKYHLKVTNSLIDKN